MADTNVEFLRASLKRGSLTKEQAEQCLEKLRQGQAKTAWEAAEEVMPAPLIQEVLLELGIEEPPERIAGFEILARIGAGLVGVVYLANQTSLDRRVAVKLLSPRYAAEKSLAEHFLRKTKAVGSLTHANLVRGIDAGEDQGYVYFAMEHVDGPTLAEFVREQGKLGIEKAVAIGADVARALDTAARRGFVHGNIKPQNIFLSKAGSAQLADLGNSLPADSFRKGRALRSPHYVAPEEMDELSEIDVRSDIYSLGCVLYHLTCGQPPFTASTTKESLLRRLREPPPNPRTVVADLPQAFVRVLGRMMAVSRDERYPDPEALLTELTAALGPARRPLSAKPKPPEPIRAGRRPAPGRGASRQSPTGRTPSRRPERARRPPSRIEAEGDELEEVLPAARPAFNYTITIIGTVIGVAVAVLLMVRGVNEHERVETLAQQILEKRHRDKLDKQIQRFTEQVKEAEANALDDLKRVLAMNLEPRTRKEFFIQILENYGRGAIYTRRAADIVREIERAETAVQEAQVSRSNVFRARADKLIEDGRFYDAEEEIERVKTLGITLGREEEKKVEDFLTDIATRVGERYQKEKKQNDEDLAGGRFAQVLERLRGMSHYGHPDIIADANRDYSEIIKGMDELATKDLRAYFDTNYRRYLGFLYTVPSKTRYREFGDLKESAQSYTSEDPLIQEMIDADAKAFALLEKFFTAAAEEIFKQEGKDATLALKPSGGDLPQSLEGKFLTITDESIRFQTKENKVIEILFTDISAQGVIEWAKAAQVDDAAFKAAPGLLLMYEKDYEGAAKSLEDLEGADADLWKRKLAWLRENLP